jgi:hypothetical protein
MSVTSLSQILQQAADERACRVRQPQSHAVTQAAVRLGPACERLARVPARRPARPQIEEVVAAWHALFRAALPESSSEVHGALTRLCAVELARARLLGQPREPE